MSRIPRGAKILSRGHSRETKALFEDFYGRAPEIGPLLACTMNPSWLLLTMAAQTPFPDTFGAMIPLVLLSRAGAMRLRWHWLDHHGHSAAGGIIAAVGLAVTLLGI